MLADFLVQKGLMDQTTSQHLTTSESFLEAFKKIKKDWKIKQSEIKRKENEKAKKKELKKLKEENKAGKGQAAEENIVEEFVSNVTANVKQAFSQEQLKLNNKNIKAFFGLNKNKNKNKKKDKKKDEK